MRPSRRTTITETGRVHKYWRGHNRENVLGTDADKKLYLESLAMSHAKRERRRLIKRHAFCLMSNHPHELDRLVFSVERGEKLQDAVHEYGNYLRDGHSRYGLVYNMRHDREGKVARERPKTGEIENDFNELRVLHYIHANPIRAGLVRRAEDYRWSSYRFYAFGEVDEYTRELEHCQAYLELGTTPEQRQKRYRRLFQVYLVERQLVRSRQTLLGPEIEKLRIEEQKLMEGLAIGGPSWKGRGDRRPISNPPLHSSSGNDPPPRAA